MTGEHVEYNVRQFRVRLPDPNNRIYANGNQQIAVEIEFQLERRVNHGPAEIIDLVPGRDALISLRPTNRDMTSGMPADWFLDDSENRFMPAQLITINAVVSDNLLSPDGSADVTDSDGIAEESAIIKQEDQPLMSSALAGTPTPAAAWQIFRVFVRTTATHMQTFAVDMFISLGDIGWITSFGSIGSRTSVTIRPVDPPQVLARELMHRRDTLIEQGIPGNQPNARRWELYVDSWEFPRGSYRIRSVELAGGAGNPFGDVALRIMAERPEVFMGAISASAERISAREIVIHLNRTHTWPSHTFTLPSSPLRAYDLFETGTPSNPSGVVALEPIVIARVTDVMGNMFFYRFHTVRDQREVRISDARPSDWNPR